MPVDPALRDALADIYGDEADARRVAIDAGLDPKHINFSGRAVNSWTSILEEADRHDRVQIVFQIACREYPSHTVLDAIAVRFTSKPQDDSLCWEKILEKSTPVANLTVELQAFVNALQSPSTQARSILLVKAGPGKGKTELLDRYRECCESGLTFAHVDLKGGTLDPLRILQRILDDLDIFNLTFPNCAQALEVEVVGYSLEKQKQIWVGALDAFKQDLRELAGLGKLSYLVLLLDTFEQASSETCQWIANELLRLTKPKSLSSLVIVVAGQLIPDPPSDSRRHCQVLQLRPPQLDDWLVYSQKVHSALTPDLVKILYEKHRDNPHVMTNMIQQFV